MQMVLLQLSLTSIDLCNIFILYNQFYLFYNINAFYCILDQINDIGMRTLLLGDSL